MKKKYRMIGMLLCLVMIFPLISPFSVFANGENFELYDDSTQNEPTLEDYLAGAVTPEEWYGTLNKDTVPEILGYEEAVSRAHVRRLYEEEGEDLNRLVFQNADGSKTVYLYDYPVKYIDENEIIQDITLDIKESSTKSGQFQTASGSAITTFSSRMDDGILLRGNQVSVSLVPQFARSVASAQIESLEEARLVDNKKVIYTYDAKTDIEYSLTYTGFKEDIVVKEYTGQTRYTFTLYTNGLKLVEEAGSFCLIDSNKTVKAVLGEIIIFTADEKNNTMGEMVAKTIVENQEYLLTIVVDEKWLADENTMYPIRIDPTVEICYDNNNLMLTDFSFHGTYINGALCHRSQQVLHSGDTIQVGGHKITITF